MSDWYNQVIPPGVEPREGAKALCPEYNSDNAKHPMETGEWEQVCACRFGEARQSLGTSSRWTGDAYRYDIYRKPYSWGDMKFIYALRWCNGGGKGWLLGARILSGEACLLAMIAAIPVEERRWDACHQLWQAAYKSNLSGISTENRRMGLAFLEKRLKRKQRNHKVYVEVLPRTAEVLAATAG